MKNEELKKETNMKNILLIQTSPRGNKSASRQMAQSVVEDLKLRHPGAHIVVRDLAENPPPHIDDTFVNAISGAQSAADQSKTLAFSDTLIDELSAADVVVFGIPMYNFGLPSTLKAWIDHIIRAGRTFSYSPETGPSGLLKGKRAILVLATGGIYGAGPAKPFDFQEPYLRTVLGFTGITDVDVVRVEGSNVSSIGPEKALASAKTQLQQVLAKAA